MRRDAGSVGFPSLHSFSYGLQTEPGWDSPLQLDTFTAPQLSKELHELQR